MTLIKALEQNALELPGKTAIIYKETAIDYGALNGTVNRLASGLMKLGVKKGGRIGLMLPRVPELVIGFLASAKAGAIVAPVNFELTAEQISSVLANIAPDCVIVHANFLDHALKSIPAGMDIPLILVSGEDKRCHSWEGLIANGNPLNPDIKVSDDDVVYLNYTSGSTGNSKGAVTTHLNIYWNTIGSIDALGLTQEDVHLCMFAPFAHPHEIFARPLYLGGSMVLLDTVYPKSLAEAISNHKVSCVMGLAPMYENLLELSEHKVYDLSSLRIPESGGMYTRGELMERFRKKLGISIVPVWGSTETTGIALAVRPGEPTPAGSTGRPCLSYDVKIVDDDGNELPSGEIGEMAFKGPAVVNGYFENKNADGFSFRDGWYFSGDLARKDRDGYFYFVERKTGMMKIAGLKVFPTEIELALLEHPAIKEVSVIAVKDRLRGEIPKAIIVLKDNASLTSKEILRFCKERISHYKMPRIVEFREALPKTGSGKVNKKALQMEHA